MDPSSSSLQTTSPSTSTSSSTSTMRPTLSDEVKRLFEIYRSYTGVEPMAGGAHNLIRLSNAVYQPTELFDAPPKKGKRKYNLDTIPVVVQIMLFEYLDIGDLCNVAQVSRACYATTNNERLWLRLLNRLLTYEWSKIYHDRNPDQTRTMYPEMSTKQICLRCDPRPSSTCRSPIIAPPSYQPNGSWSIHLRKLLAVQRPRVLMFGPGLETDASRIVRRMLNDENVKDIAEDKAAHSFRVLGMMAGEVSGMGSGIKMKLDEKHFNLITLYGNTKSLRQRHNGDQRVQQNKLFVSDTNDMVELSPQVRQLCKRTQGFVFVVDAYSTLDEVSTYRAELIAMLCNLWSPNDAVLLVLVCDGSENGTQDVGRRLRPIDVVRALRLGRVNRRWVTQAGNVHTLRGVREGFHWLTNMISK